MLQKQSNIRIMRSLVCLMCLCAVQGAWADDVTVTCIDGTSGIPENGREDALQLFDGNRFTKWCSHFDSSDGAYVIFKFSEPRLISNYTLVDSEDIYFRMWRHWDSWKLYGANFASDYEARSSSSNTSAWNEVDSRSGQKYTYQFFDNYAQTYFGDAYWRYSSNPLIKQQFNTSNPGIYQYYMIRITDIGDVGEGWDGNPDDVQAMGDLLFTTSSDGIHFEAQPQSATYDKDATATELNASATSVSGQAVSYQWYKDGVAISGATNARYTPSTDTYATSDYFCEVSVGDCIETSDVATIKVWSGVSSAAAPTITTQPSSWSGLLRNGSSTLTVEAQSTDGGTLSYQWLSSDAADGTFSLIKGANTAEYTPNTSTDGCCYYRCLVSNTHPEGDKASVCTQVATVFVSSYEAATLVSAQNCESLGLSTGFIGYFAIANASQLHWFAEKVVCKGHQNTHAVLTADITLNQNVLKNDHEVNSGTFEHFKPIVLPDRKYLLIYYSEIADSGYSGTFDGNGHTISGLYQKDPNMLYGGLFGYLNGATIQNLGIVDAYINTSTGMDYEEYENYENPDGYNDLKNKQIGGFCGFTKNYSKISNCYFKGLMVGDGAMGGICGYLTLDGMQTQGSKIENCYSICTLDCMYFNYPDATAYEGYLVAQTNDSHLITNSYGAKSVSADSRFSSGEICFRLNNGNTDGTQKWYQKLGAGGDAAPAFVSTGSNTVYKGYTDCIHFYYSNTPYNDSYAKDPFDHNLTGTFICSVCGEPTSLETGTLADKSVYTRTTGLTIADFTYTRTFASTAWATWYVPFELELTEELLQKYSFSRINNVHQYDRDNDGVAEETVIESFRQRQGTTLSANYPYLVKPLTEEDLDMVIDLDDCSLRKADENSYYCRSVDYKYTFSGTYSGKGDSGTAATSPYALFGDGTWCHYTSLPAQRHYLTIEPTSSNYNNGAPARIVLQETGEEDATGIVTLYDEADPQRDVYDLSGMRTTHNMKGLHIENGKVVFIQ